MKRSYAKVILSFCLILIFCLKSDIILAQNTVTIGGTDTRSDAVLWLVPNNNQGLILPVTSRSGFTPSEEGMIIYDPSANSVFFWDGSSWIDISSGGGGSTYELLINGPNLELVEGGSNVVNSIPITTFHDGVDDADNDPTNELQNISQVLTISTDAGAQRITNLQDPAANQDAATKLYVDNQISLIPVPILNLNDLQDVLAAGPLNGQVLQFNGTDWIPATLPGGGDMLQSTYDTNTNGTVDDAEAVGGNTAAQLLDRTNHTGTQLSSTISDFDASADTRSDLRIAASDVSALSNVNAPAPAINDVLQWNGTDWVNVVLPGGGDMLQATYDANTNSIVDDAEAVGGNTAAQLLDRTNHTGTQLSTTISDFNTAADARVAAADISTLNNVNAPAPAVNDVLQWDGTNWVPIALPGGGDLLAANNLSDLADIPTAIINLGLGSLAILNTVSDAEISNLAPSKLLQEGAIANDVLQWNGANWAPVALPGGGDMLAATYDPGAIGGDVFDRANHIGTQLSTTISDFNTAADARADTRIAASGVSALSDVNAPAPAINDILQFDGINWVPIALPGGGDMLAATYDPGGIAADAFDRTNHIGTQLSTTISDFNIAADARADTRIAASGVSALSDVNAPAPAINDILQFDGINWVPIALPVGGDMLVTTYDPGGIAADAFDRTNHIGTQLSTTISDFDLAADARVAAADISTLNNVNALAPAIGDVLQWDGANWVNIVLPGGGDMFQATYDPGAIAGDVFDRTNHIGTQLAATISDFDAAADARIDLASIQALVDVNTAPPLLNDVLQFDGSEWVPVAIPGGGDMLAATYDPGGIVADAFDRANHTGTQLATTISDFDISVDSRIDLASIQTLADVNTTPPAVNDILQFDGTEWIPTVFPGLSGASNGLNVNGSDVELGGTLANNTTIDINSFILSLNNGQVSMTGGNPGSFKTRVSNNNSGGGSFFPGDVAFNAITTGDAVDDKHAVQAYAGGSAGTKIGVYSRAHGAGTNYGVYGFSQDAASAFGIFGEAASGTGTNTGVRGEANSAATTNFGVYGEASNGTTNWAGYFTAAPTFISALSVGNNTQGPYALDISGESNFEDVMYMAGDPGTAGYVLVSDAGTGPPIWTDPTLLPGGSGLISNPGSNNLFAGVGNSNIGTNSAIFGPNAGSSNAADGINNTFMGANAGFSNTTGDDNTFIGRFTGELNQQRSFNTFIGSKAGQNYNEDGTPSNQLNTFLGFRAGYSAGGGGNLIVGAQVGEQVTGTANIIIGNEAAGKESTRTAQVGGADLTGSRNVFIGNQSGEIHTVGNENVNLGFASGQDNQTGNKNIFIGWLAGSQGSFSPGNRNILIGPEAQFGATNLSNAIAIGGQAVVSSSNTIVLGQTGTDVQFDGALMPANDAGTAGQVLTSQGAGVTPIWSSAGGSGWGLTGNTGTNPVTDYIGTTDATDFVIGTNGTERMRVASTGAITTSNSLTVSDASLYVNDIGDDDNAWIRATSGTDWLFGPNNLVWSGSYVIGRFGEMLHPPFVIDGTLDQVTIQEKLIASGDDAVDFTSNAFPLEVYSSSAAGSFIDFISADDFGFNTNPGAFGIGYLANTGGNPGGFVINDKVAVANRFFITNNGDVGIGTTVPTSTLSVNGTADKIGGGAWAAFSDRRLKEDISPFTEGLEVLMKVNPTKFKYNGLGSYKKDGKEYVGVIAQDIKKIAPYMISSVPQLLNESDTEMTNILKYDGTAMTYILINSVKEQQKIINDLNERISDLENLLQEEKSNYNEIRNILETEISEIKTIIGLKATN